MSDLQQDIIDAYWKASDQRSERVAVTAMKALGLSGAWQPPRTLRGYVALALHRIAHWIDR